MRIVKRVQRVVTMKTTIRRQAKHLKGFSIISLDSLFTLVSELPIWGNGMKLWGVNMDSTEYFLCKDVAKWKNYSEHVLQYWHRHVQEQIRPSPAWSYKCRKSAAVLNVTRGRCSSSRWQQCKVGEVVTPYTDKYLLLSMLKQCFHEQVYSFQLYHQIARQIFCHGIISFRYQWR